MAKTKALEPTLVYVLLFRNPFEKANEKYLSGEINIKEAEENFLNIYKTSRTDLDKSLIPDVFRNKIPWLKEAADKPDDCEDKIFVRHYLIAVISALLTSIKYELFLDYQLLMSRDKDEIYVKIYANEDWFISKAKNLEYKLQFRQTYKDEELAEFPFKKFPPFGPINLVDVSEKNLKLFKRYEADGKEEPDPDCNNESYFLYTDKARLVIQILYLRFNFTALKNYEALVEDFCVHQKKPLKFLKFNWARFSKLFHSQPLDEIRKYYSEKIALYFAWLGTYCHFMFFAACIGLIAQILLLIYDDDLVVKQIIYIFFAVFLTFWASAFNQVWNRSEKFFASRWGTVNISEIEYQRSEFKGTYKRDEVTGRMKVIEKEGAIRFLRVIFSYSFILVMILCVIGAVALILLFRVFLSQHVDKEYKDKIYIKAIPGILNAISIKITNTIYEKIAKKLNDWENHETDNLYNDHLSVKLFFFKFVNSYSSLIYLCFFIEETMCNNNDCIGVLSIQLIMILLTNLFMNSFELGIPWLKIYRKKAEEKKKIEESSKEDKSLRLNMYSVEKQAKKERYESPLEDYMEMAIQFGYIALFGASLPFVCFLAFVEIILEIRVDAWKITKLMKRPNPNRAEDIGVWRQIIIIIAYFGSVTNSGIIFITMKLVQDDYLKIFGFILVEHIMILGMYFIDVVVPDIPDTVKDSRDWASRTVLEKKLEGKTKKKEKAELSRSKGEEPFWIIEKDIKYG